MQIHLNIVSRDDHAPEAEHKNRTIKEKVRCVYNKLPFTKIPDQMLINITYGSIFWLNAFPSANSISKQQSPRQIITGKCIDYNKYFNIEFDQYAQTHEQHDSTMLRRTIGALCMRPTGNEQGGHFSLA